MWPAPDPEDTMLAFSIQQFVTNLVDWLPQFLRHIAELAVYFAFLTAMMLIPLGLWLGYAIASTKKRERSAVPAPRV